VARECNIGCNYCDRKLSCRSSGTRPGWTSEVLAPEDAVLSLEPLLETHPNLDVVGVAGPGEPLFNEETFQTLDLVNKTYPNLKKCVCTNGLLLSSKIDELRQLNVDYITVTINAATPDVGARIYGFIKYEGTKYYGSEASEILIQNQLEGLEAAHKSGFLVKVNTVLIPEINMKDIDQIAALIRDRGAYIMNIMPLIPAGKFNELAPPSCDDLKSARAVSEQIIPQFRKCKQCRADACGVPGLE
jgi:nitrogen fixation protein NifB